MFSAEKFSIGWHGQILLTIIRSKGTSWKLIKDVNFFDDTITYISTCLHLHRNKGKEGRLRVGADGIGVDATERHTSKSCQASGADQSSVDSENITWYTKASLRDHSANLQSIKQESTWGRNWPWIQNNVIVIWSRVSVYPSGVKEGGLVWCFVQLKLLELTTVTILRVERQHHGLWWGLIILQKPCC